MAHSSEEEENSWGGGESEHSIWVLTILESVEEGLTCLSLSQLSEDLSPVVEGVQVLKSIDDSS